MFVLFFIVLYQRIKSVLLKSIAMKFYIMICFYLICFYKINAQNMPIDFDNSKAQNILIEGCTISSLDGGFVELPMNCYWQFKGLKLRLAGFQKLEKSVSDKICSLTVEYKKNDSLREITTSFWTEGQKILLFNSWKEKGKNIEIDPRDITAIRINLGKGKKVDVVITLLNK